MKKMIRTIVMTPVIKPKAAHVPYAEYKLVTLMGHKTRARQAPAPKIPIQVPYAYNLNNYHLN